MDIAPVHAALSQVVVLVITDRDVLTDGDGIEILNSQEHMVAIEANSVTLVERGHVSTHDTFVASVGVRTHELRTVGTTGQGYRMILLYGIVIGEQIPPVGAFPTVGNLGENGLRYGIGPVHRST